MTEETNRSTKPCLNQSPCVIILSSKVRNEGGGGSDGTRKTMGIKECFSTITSEFER